MKSIRKSITAPENCTACSLCANICPRRAIRMKWNKDGFLVPEVNNDACVDCGLCARQCPALIKAEAQDNTPGAFQSTGYAAWSTDEQILRESSSGGVFSEVAKYIIQQGGCVYGVRWEEKLQARFHRIEREEELAQFRGSKYVQAEVGMAYKQVLMDLNTGRKVLFAGTPCQVHALNVYLKKTYENLITISLACHGVPSRLLAERYVAEQEQNEQARMTGWQFRNKLNGWVEFLMVNEYSNGKVMARLKHKDDYMRVFLADVAMKKACFTCVHSYANNAIPEIGDIALGDFWNVRKYHPDWNVFKGISVVLCHSAKGDLAIKSLAGSRKLVVYEEEYSVAHHSADTELGHDEAHLLRVLKLRESVLKMLRRKEPMRKILRRTEREVSICGIHISEMNPVLRVLAHIVKRVTRKPSPRVGILTENLFSNYGGLLQAFALQHAVKSLGYDAFTIHYTNTGKSVLSHAKNLLAEILWRSHILPPLPLPHRVQGAAGRRFIPGNVRRTKLATEREMSRLEHRYKLSHVIVGSDQVWNAEAKPLRMPFFYLSWASERLRKRSISYAASFGRDALEYSEQEYLECAHLLSQFRAVSTREASGTTLCAKMGVNASQQPDPTLLLSFDDYDSVIADGETCPIPENTIALYLLDRNEPLDSIVQDAALSMNRGVYEMNSPDAYSEPVSVAQWLRAIRDSEYLITDSFHGCVFAIIFNKAFVCLGNERRGNARFDTLLGTFGLEDRMVTNPTTAAVLHALHATIDWYRVNEIHDAERERGIHFLKESLT
ncbi:MAG: polysaccharide pyruvyl transferase family protein [Akkermansia sp.]|nr:polysaccharide pyruvyl transferase family protein [Akkermansia sp.]